MARTVELDGEYRLPASEHHAPVLDEQRREGAQQELAAVRVSVDGLVERDVEPALEVVVLVPGARRCQALEQALEVAQQQRLVFIDRAAEGRMQRLQIDAAGAQPGAAHLLLDPRSDVDELGGVRRLELQPVGAHLDTPRASCRSSRAEGAGDSEAAADESDSIARANATWTASGAWSARSREPRARHRSPIRSVVGGAARPPRPWSLTPTSISAAARASLGCVSGPKWPTRSR